jgi:hypothetical protein
MKVTIQNDSIVDDLCQIVKDPHYSGNLLNGIGSMQLYVESSRGSKIEKNVSLSYIDSSYDTPIKIFINQRVNNDVKEKTGMKLRSGFQL